LRPPNDPGAAEKFEDHVVVPLSNVNGRSVSDAASADTGAHEALDELALE
jgi:hypothetical protein